MYWENLDTCQLALKIRGNTDWNYKYEELYNCVERQSSANWVDHMEILNLDHYIMENINYRYILLWQRCQLTTCMNLQYEMKNNFQEHAVLPDFWAQ